jgi:FkbM family methyltransferase
MANGGGDALRRRAVDAYRAVKAPLRPYVRRNWNRPVMRATATQARRWLAVYENGDHNLATNGEAALLGRLPAGSVRVAFDVGCHQGTWTDALLAVQPAARVHAFEASPPTGAALVERYATDDRVVVHPVGLGDEPGRLVLHSVEGHGDINSFVAPATADAVAVEVEVRTGDDVLADLGDDVEIDLLKIDTEGFDLRVVQGFVGALAAGRIAMLQFEYNAWNIESRALLIDFYELLEPLGYRLGKVHPTDVDLRPYRVEDENWIGPAVVAVRSDRPDLIAALRP